MSRYPSKEAHAALDALQTQHSDDWQHDYREHVAELRRLGLIGWSIDRGGYAISRQGWDVLRGEP
jgi:hypothetical protein